MGAMALHEFAGMIRKRYAVDGIRLELSDQAMVFRSAGVMDVLTAGSSHRRAQPS